MGGFSLDEDFFLRRLTDFCVGQAYSRCCVRPMQFLAAQAGPDKP
jgi:hypothetical protein